MGEKDKKTQPEEGASVTSEKRVENPASEQKVASVTAGVAVAPAASLAVAPSGPGHWEEEGVRLIQAYVQEIRSLWHSMKSLQPSQKQQAKTEFLLKVVEILRGVERLKGSARLTPYSVTNSLVPIEKRFAVLVEMGAHGEFKDLDLVCALQKEDFDFLESKVASVEGILAQVQVRAAVSSVVQANRPHGPGMDNGEDWKSKSEFPYASIEEFRAIQEARRLFKESDMNSQMKGLKLLEERGLLANVAYDRIHQSGTHQFSGRSLDEPNEFAELFAERTGMGPKSVVLDTGCGMGSDSVCFAKKGAKVVALDTSRYALDIFQKKLTLFHPELIPRITMLCQDTRRALASMLGSERVTHIYGFSSWHYDPPMVLKAKLKAAYNILDRNRDKGYLGLAIKTIDSDSARADRHYRLTMGDDLNYSMDKEDRILRLYPEEDMLTELVAQAEFTSILLDIKPIEGYDKPGETEVFRQVIAKVPGTPNRRRRR
ncbi:class I SAM-dependent methyltransferase [Candidatus Peregrinibacteria bacterium]|nr:class I SAM-dependent methyltransferase [Candidatus Peregrinibacteria bacterium]